MTIVEEDMTRTETANRTTKLMMGGATAALVAALAFSSPAQAQNDRVVIGYTPPTLDISDFMGQFEIGMKEALDDLEWDYQLVSRSPVDHTAHSQQRNIVDDLITMQVDYMVLIPTSFETQIPAYRAVNAAGIPLIIGNYLDPLPEESGVDVLRYAGYSHAEGGRMAGNFMAENLEPGSKIAILYGDPGLVSNERGGVAKEILEQAGMEIVGEEYAEWDRDMAFQATQDLLTRNPDLDVIYAASSAMAIGAVAATRASGLVPNVDVRIVGFGGTIEELDAILAGNMWAAVFRDPIATGAGAVEAIRLHREGRADEVELSWGVPLEIVYDCESIVELVHPVTFTSEGREAPTADSC